MANETKIASNPIELRKRIVKYFSNQRKKDFVQRNRDQHYFDFPQNRIATQWSDLDELFEFLKFANPFGGAYIFGGMLRDIAMFGNSGFNSDIDLVIDGDWSAIDSLLSKSGIEKNKFGGYRIHVSGVLLPVDIWQAENTWAIKKGLVEYRDISSLLDTTVANWDSILMNWDTKSLIYRQNYFEEIGSRHLDLILKDNPNKLGMLVRMFRYILKKDAHSISSEILDYLLDQTSVFNYEEVSKSESNSYTDSLISRASYDYFKKKTKLDIANRESLLEKKSFTPINHSVSGQGSLF
jgi:hypothetical protein